MNKIDFQVAPNIGTILVVGSQKYEMVAVKPHVTNDGRRTSLLTWRTRCPTCDAPFEVVSGLVSKGINRRCAEHRAALKPVSGNRKRIKAKVIPQ